MTVISVEDTTFNLMDARSHLSEELLWSKHADGRSGIKAGPGDMPFAVSRPTQPLYVQLFISCSHN